MKIIETIRKYPLFSKSYNILRSFMWVIESKYYQMKTPSQREDLVARQYKKVSNENLDWTNLQTYNEKMQWAKLYEDISTKTKLADKYLVRDWVAEKIGEEYLIPVLGVWESFQEIDFNELPKSFVLKANHAAGTNIIVSDKANLNVKYAEFLFNNWLKVNYAYFSLFQMQYEKIKPKIIAEEFIQDSKGGLTEFKFFCFHGEVYYCWFILETETHRYGNIYDLEWILQPWKFKGRENTPFNIPKPKNYDEMIEIARKLSKSFSHVRVDLYSVDGRIYFGEMTFTTASGYRLVKPDKFNYLLGNLWNLNNEVKS